VRSELDSYECRHGAAYTRISSTRKGIAVEIEYFVPLTDVDDPAPCELWVMTVRNTGAAPRRLRSFSYAEFSFADAMNDLTNLDWAQHIVAGSCDDGVIRVATKFRPLTFFFGSSARPDGYTCDREDFVGRSRDLADPIVVETGDPSNKPSPRGNSIGSLSHDILLAPGEERQIVYIMGATEKPAEIGRVPVALHGGNAGRGHERDAQLLEPGSVPHHSVLVALRLRLRDGPGPRHGHTRQRPGHTRHDAHRAGPRPPNADPDLDDAVRRRPHLAPVLPAHR
jgi:cellobiose phosphorylase